MLYLENKRLYLSGPIQFGDGSDWRSEPKKILKDKFGFNVFDPLADPKQQWFSILEEAMATKNYEKVVSIAKMFVRKDLAMVDRADLIIAYVPYKIPTTGVCHEIINSNNAKKPTLLVSNCNDIAYIPIWYFGFIPLEFMFPNWDALFKYLEEVNLGKHKDNYRWSFIYGDI
jgi:hypothetical protein